MGKLSRGAGGDVLVPQLWQEQVRLRVPALTVID